MLVSLVLILYCQVLKYGTVDEFFDVRIRIFVYPKF